MLSLEISQSHLPPSSRVSLALLRKLERIVSGHGEVSIAFVGEREMRRLNRLYRGKDSVTDVLSFELPLGQVVICYAQAKRQASERGHTVKQEVLDLIIHGILHALGYDHERPKDANVMLPLQRKIYAKATSSD